MTTETISKSSIVPSIWLVDFYADYYTEDEFMRMMDGRDIPEEKRRDCIESFHIRRRSAVAAR